MDAYQIIDLSWGGQAEVAALRPIASGLSWRPGRLDCDRNSPAGRNRRPTAGFLAMACEAAPSPTGRGRPMTVPRLSTRLLLRPQTFRVRDDFEVVGVIQPGGCGG